MIVLAIIVALAAALLTGLCHLFGALGWDE